VLEDAKKPSATRRRIAAIRYVATYYKGFVRPVGRAMAEQRLILDNFIEDAGMTPRVHTVRSRVKSEESVTEALCDGPFESLSDFPDMAGIRVVVHSLKDVEVIARCFLRQVEIGKNVKLLADLPKDSGGYRARHLRLEIGGSYVRSAWSVRMEVQIRTLCQELFNTFSRTYWYKSPHVVPDAAKRDELNAQLSRAEGLVTELQDSADATNAAHQEEALSPDSFVRIINELFHEEVPLGEAVDSVVFHRDRGVETNGDLRKLFSDTGPQLAELVELEKALPEGERTLTKLLTESPGKAYSRLLFIAHGAFEIFKRHVEERIAKLSAEGDERPS